MTLSRSYKLHCGRIQGREHRRALRDGQDGLAVWRGPAGLGLAVTDGCGSAPGSEVGARLAATWLASHGPRALASVAPRDLARRLGEDLQGFLASVVDALDADGARDEAVASMFLFSFVCAFVTSERVAVLAQGDGLAAYNDERGAVLPGEGNAPDYPGYGLLGLPHGGPTVLFDRPAVELQSLLIATDGLFPLLGTGAPDEDPLAALRDGAVGARHPSWLERRLRALSHEGVFMDDVAVAIVARAS
ncbi:MAG TPA: protein phosphatase 2C domain-containing protein [Polyangiaceae bacterium]|nr:protein phosphatase 2C domain-containing protein [Polyangiaceae bacterium]